MGKSINELTKQEFESEFNRLMPTIPKEQQINKQLFLEILVFNGLLLPKKFKEFINESNTK